MGLDSYWVLRHRKSEYDFGDEDNIAAKYPEAIRKISDNSDCSRCIVTLTSYDVGYFRKFNAMHKWVVDNCADGVDECQDIKVDRQHAAELLGICKDILAAQQNVADPEGLTAAVANLPPASGFFFGSTDCDEWYFNDVAALAGLLTDIIAAMDGMSEEEADNWSLVYCSSW